MDILRKIFPISAKDAAITENMISGAASVTGVMDRSWAKDVMCPGCFAGAIEGFMANGFVPSGHNWSDYDKLVAMPTLAEERGNQLYCQAKFHSTDYAQTVRKICQERLEEGLAVGLSVGFSIADDGALWFPNGKELMAWATGKGFNTAKFDPSIMAHEGDCRAIWSVGELYEYSIVTVPANRFANVDQVKSFPIDGCVTLADRAAAVCVAAGQVQAEIKKLVELRSADGRLPLDRLKQAKELGDQLLMLAGLVSEDDPNPDGPEDSPDTADAKSLLLDAEAFLLTA